MLKIVRHFSKCLGLIRKRTVLRSASRGSSTGQAREPNVGPNNLAWSLRLLAARMAAVMSARSSSVRGPDLRISTSGRAPAWRLGSTSTACRTPPSDGRPDDASWMTRPSTSSLTCAPRQSRPWACCAHDDGHAVVPSHFWNMGDLPNRPSGLERAHTQGG